jgi:hypothetical protein
VNETVPQSRKRRSKERPDDVVEGVENKDNLSNNNKAELSRADHQFDGSASLIIFLHRLYVAALKNRLLASSTDARKGSSGPISVEHKSRSKHIGIESSVASSSKIVSVLSHAPTKSLDQVIQIKATEWICKFCTLLNDGTRRVCDACGSQCTLSSNKASKMQPKRKPDDVLVAEKTNKKTPVQLKFATATGGSVKTVNKKHEVVVISDDDDDVIETGATILESKTASRTIPSPSTAVASNHQRKDTDCIDVSTEESAPSASVSLSDLDILLQMPPIPIDMRDSSQTSNPLSSKWGDVIVPSKNWGHIVVELTGRRIGDKRKGKNLLIGEQLLIDIMLHMILIE